MMKKIDMVKINRSNKDIWFNLNEAFKSKNLALIESSIRRLMELQKYYINLLNFQQIEINQLKDLLEQEESIRNDFEREWLEQLAKKTGQYETHKQRIEELYKKL